MKIALVLLALLLAAASVFGAWVRLSVADPAQWHVDPDAVTERGARNSVLVRDGGDLPTLRLAQPPAEVAARLEAIALATPRTVRVAGEGLWVTYVTRSALWGFPDYTSVKVVPDGAGSAVTIFARARFGESDFGVNRARVESWLSQLAR